MSSDPKGFEENPQMPLSAEDEEDIIDADGIADYISADNPKAARLVIDRIDQAVARLATFPYFGARAGLSERENLSFGRPPMWLFGR